jgi:hypothetical protein
MLSAFFSRARTACNVLPSSLGVCEPHVFFPQQIATFGALIYLGLYFVSFGITDETTASAKIGISLLSPVAMGQVRMITSNI